MSRSNCFQDLKLVAAVVSGSQMSTLLLFSGSQMSSRYCFQDLKLVAAIVSGPQGIFRLKNLTQIRPKFQRKN
jgi:hypothetical protein